MVIWSIAFLMVLGQLDLSIAPLLASAGVAGLALGFGAQSLVRDTLAGFFILLENQFGVGDVVETQTTGGPVTGKVESLTLRITTLRAFDGTLHIVPNGNMQVISNKSRGWARAIVDVRLPYGEDVDKVRGILEDLFDEVRDRAPLKDWLRDGPSVLGIEALSDYALVVRVIADTRPSKRFDAERMLREAIQARLAEQGIRVPLPPTPPPRAPATRRGCRGLAGNACGRYPSAMGETPYSSVDELQAALGGQSYLADRGLATSIHLALSLDKPLLLEGEAGVGKTEVAKVLSSLLGRRLIRLQCYEGIDASQALYEWNYSRQLIAVRAMDATDAETHVQDLFGPDFLVERPLLAAIRAGSGAVLLVDELDRADDEFEAFLLEVLSEFAVTIPEIGRIAAETPPAVIVTSNRTRELHDALKRRCLYHWIDHPELEREIQIVRVRAPHVSEALARDVAAAVLRLREMDLAKLPGVAETIDWANALAFLGAERLDTSIAADTLGAVVKDHEDQQLVSARLADVVGDG